MKRLFICFIICIIAGGVLVNCEQKPLEEDDTSLKEDLWHTLLKDSLFIEVGDIMNNRKSLEDLKVFIGDIPLEDIGTEVEQYLYARQQKVQKNLAALRRLYPGFSSDYFLALQDSVNNIPLTRTSRQGYYMEEITVLGDCRYAAAVLQEILTDIEVIKKEYFKIYPPLPDYRFYAMLSAGWVVGISERAGLSLKVICDELARGFVPNGCYKVVNFAEQMRTVGGVYLVELRDILNNAMFNMINHPEKKRYNHSTGGGGSAGRPGGSYEEQSLNSLPVEVQNVVDKVLAAFEKNGLSVSFINSKISVIFKTLSDGNLAEIRFRAPPGETYFTYAPMLLVLPPYSSDEGYLLIVAHELIHLALFDISLKAGNIENLKQINPMLARYLDLNIHADPHHEYMGKMTNYEQILRDAFPGKSREFYEYGKWGGGLMDSRSFDKLPENEQKAIRKYLKAHKLP